MIPITASIAEWFDQRFRQADWKSTFFSKIVDRIRNSLELKVVLQTATDEVAQFLKADACLFFWTFNDLQQIHIVCECVTSGQKTYIGHYPFEKLGDIAALLQTEELIVNVGQLSAAPGLAWIAQAFAPKASVSAPTQHSLLGAQASLLVPVKELHGCSGFMVCLMNQPRRWLPSELEFVQMVAQQLEIAIRQAQLYETTQKQARREQLVNQITTQTRQSLDLSTILRQAIAQLLDVLEVDRCLVHLVENVEQSPSKDDNLSELAHTSFRRRHLFEAFRNPFSPSIEHFDTNGPITQWVIQNRQTVVIADITQDPRIAPDNVEYQLAQIKSSLVLPVQANGRLQAILYLNQCGHVRYWSKDDQKLAQAVADQLALSIKQAQLYARTQQQAIASAAQAQHLSATLDNLKKAQSQLVQSEKMSSLGQMIAGLAHEINNPISFIYGNIPFVDQYVKDLVRLIEAYQTRLPQTDAALTALTKEIEFEFLLNDLPKILTSMKVGASRVRDIIATLRSFSQVDGAERQMLQLHDVINNALFVLQNHIPEGIQLNCNYSPLPPMEGYPRLLSQVFMNLLINAAEALAESSQLPKTIHITTEHQIDELTEAGWIQIVVADNGCGILPDVQPKIFDPFFTTKPVGKGTGLGLAVCYQTIVHQHRGHLNVCSQPGKGTQIMIRLPIKHTALVRSDRPRVSKDSSFNENAGLAESDRSSIRPSISVS